MRALRGPAVRPWPAACAIALLATGCANDPLFKADHGVRIVAPRDLAHVTTPLTLSWQASSLPGKARQFAVFVDRAPVRPWQPLKAVAGDDRSCRESAGCPDAAYLRRHNV